MTRTEALKIIANSKLPFTPISCPFSRFASAKFPDKSSLTGLQLGPCLRCGRPDLPLHQILVIETTVSRTMTSCQPLSS